MQALYAIGYFALGLFQLVAIIAGLTEWLGLHWIVAAFIGFFVTYIPGVGTILGIVGAHIGFGWSWLASVLLFVGPIACVAVVFSIFFFLGRMKRQ